MQRATARPAQGAGETSRQVVIVPTTVGRQPRPVSWRYRHAPVSSVVAWAIAFVELAITSCFISRPMSRLPPRTCPLKSDTHLESGRRGCHR